MVYHSLTEAIAMYVRSLGIPMLAGIENMCGMTQQEFKNSMDEDQFQSTIQYLLTC